MLPASIRKLSYNPAVRGLVQQFHLGGLARRLYCRLLSSSGVLQISCLGVHSTFHAENHQQLAFVDSIITTEKNVIEATLSELANGDVFLDVGSHYGIYSVLASKLVGTTGRVIAIEPHPGTLAILRENIASNHCENVDVLNVALSDTAGLLALAYNQHGSHVQRASDPISSVHQLDAVAGDEVLANFSIPNVVKIDVEGHEFAVLRGLRRTLSHTGCRLLCLEIHPPLLPAGENEEEILAFIRDSGFTISSQSARSHEIHVVATRRD
jgi:FkbM family methyltransferase